jgi:hypothetical protein
VQVEDVQKGIRQVLGGCRAFRLRELSLMGCQLTLVGGLGRACPTSAARPPPIAV